MLCSESMRPKQCTSSRTAQCRSSTSSRTADTIGFSLRLFPTSSTTVTMWSPTTIRQLSASASATYARFASPPVKKVHTKFAYTEFTFTKLALKFRLRLHTSRACAAPTLNSVSQMDALRPENTYQCCSYSRNTGNVTSKLVYFYYH